MSDSADLGRGYDESMFTKELRRAYGKPVDEHLIRLGRAKDYLRLRLEELAGYGQFDFIEKAFKDAMSSRPATKPAPAYGVGGTVPGIAPPTHKPEIADGDVTGNGIFHLDPEGQGDSSEVKPTQPIDGEVRCLACNKALNRNDKNCWACGSTKLSKYAAHAMDWLIEPSEQEAAPREQEKPKFLSGMHISKPLKRAILKDLKDPSTSSGIDYAKIGGHSGCSKDCMGFSPSQRALIDASEGLQNIKLDKPLFDWSK